MGLAPIDAPLAIALLLMPVSVPLWWLGWKRFRQNFVARQPVDLGEGRTAFFLSLKKPTLKFYFSLLEIFLPIMAANGVITLEL